MLGCEMAKAPDKLPHHHHENIKKRYRRMSVSSIEKDIQAKYTSALQANISGDNNVLVMKQAIDSVGSDAFVTEYANALTELVNESFGNNAQYINFTQAGAENFTTMINQAKAKIQEGENNMAIALHPVDIIIESLRSVVKVRLGVDMGYTKGYPPYLFFAKLATVFTNSNDPALQSLVSYCHSLKRASLAIYSSNGDVKKIKKGLGQLQGSWIKILGEGLWELISAQAKSIALERMFTELEKMPSTDGYTIIVHRPKQTGSARINGRQIKTDSFVTIEFVNNATGVSCFVKVADSTKLSMSTGTISAQNGEGISKGYKVKNSFSYEELFGIDKLSNAWSYWREKFGAFLGNRDNDNTQQNWNNTFEVMEMYATYAALTGGEPGYVIPNTLTINDKIYMMQALIMKKGTGRIAGRKNNVGGYPSGYFTYVKNQKSVPTSENSSKSNDPHNPLYTEWIQKILQKKLRISINPFK